MISITSRGFLLCFSSDTVATYKDDLLSYRNDTTYATPWNFRLKDIFGSIDEYTDRLLNIKAIFQAAHDFFKLEKVEFGGVNGRDLNRRKLITLSEYQTLFNAWSSIRFDPLHSAVKEFNRVRSNYQQEAEALERKLANIIDEAFDGSGTTEHCLQLMEIISTLAYRPVIYKQIAHRFNEIFEYYSENLDAVMRLFRDYVEKVTLFGVKVCFGNDQNSLVIKASQTA